MPQKKPILPLLKELNENPSSRSAKLRYLIKKENIFEIETDVLEKFKYLIELENLGSKL
jgi:16S rRNA (cytosine1402-N4)-methyltransferase